MLGYGCRAEPGAINVRSSSSSPGETLLNIENEGSRQQPRAIGPSRIRPTFIIPVNFGPKLRTRHNYFKYKVILCNSKSATT